MLKLFLILSTVMVASCHLLHAGDTPPHYLYKVLSVEDWKASQGSKQVKLSADDSAFIHLSTEEQLPRILEKYWVDVPHYVILKLDSSRLKGKLVLEANPGGSNRYWHLYDGSIPIDAIVLPR